MNAKEYLEQSYRLDQHIQFNLAEIAKLHKLSQSVLLPLSNRSPENILLGSSSLTDCNNKIVAIEEAINVEITRLIELKKEICDVIDSIDDVDEQMVLRYRYIHNETWAVIGDKLNADSRTVRRWHEKALSHVIVPQKYIQD